MATRPQTIGYALLDSPVALAAWLLDHDTDSYQKIARAFVDGQPAGNLTRDHILDNITLYWLTGTGASAARSYWEDGLALAAAPARLLRRSRSRSASPPSRRDLADSAQLGRELVPQRRLLQRGRQGRPLRRVGGAGAVLTGDPGGLRVAPLTQREPRAPARVRRGDRLAQLGAADRRTACAGRSSSSTSGRTRASTGCARLPTSAPGPRSTRINGLVVVGVHTPEFPFERDVDNVRLGRRGDGRRLSGRARQRLRGLAAPSPTTTGRPSTSPTRRANPPPPVRRGRVRGVRTGHPAAAARSRSRGHRRRPGPVVARRARGAGRLDDPGVAGDLPRLRRRPELRVAGRRELDERAPTRSGVEAQPVGALRGLDDGSAARPC